MKRIIFFSVALLFFSINSHSLLAQTRPVEAEMHYPPFEQAKNEPQALTGSYELRSWVCGRQSQVGAHLAVPMIFNDAGTVLRGLGQILNPALYYRFLSGPVLNDSSELLEHPDFSDKEYIDQFEKVDFYTVDSITSNIFVNAATSPMTHSGRYRVYVTSFDFSSNEYKTQGFVRKPENLELVLDYEMTPEFIRQSTTASIKTQILRFTKPLKLLPTQSLVVIYVNETAPGVGVGSYRDPSVEVQFVRGTLEYRKGQANPNNTTPPGLSEPLDSLQTFGLALTRTNNLDTIFSIWKYGMAGLPGTGIAFFDGNGIDRAYMNNNFTIMGHLNTEGVSRQYGTVDPTSLSLSLTQNPIAVSAPVNVGFSIPKSGKCSIAIYTVEGKMIHSLLDKYIAIGNYSVDEPSLCLSAGAYFVRLQVGEQSVTQKLIIQ